VTKFNSTGTGLIASSFLGGSGPNMAQPHPQDGASAIALDNNNNVYLTGSTNSIDFPHTQGVFQGTQPSGQNSAFVTKVNADFGTLGWSTWLGGRGTDAGNALAVDSARRVYVAGTTSSSDFPTTAGAYQTLYTQPTGFVTRVKADGTGLEYSTLLDGATPAGVAVDAQNNATVAGTATASFRTVVGPQTSYGGGGSDAFVARLNSAGSNMSWAGFIGGSGIDVGAAVALDTHGDVYLAGTTSSADLPGGAQGTQRFGGNNDAFVSKVFASSWTSNGNYSLKHDSTLSVSAADGVLSNDVSPSGQPLTASLYAYAGANGTLTLNADGSFRYVPRAGFSGIDSFSYTATDGIQTSPPTQVVLSVNSQAGFHVFGTGVDDKGNLLPDGASDPHYSLTSVPAGETVDPGAPIVTRQNGFPIGSPYWVVDGPASKWISPHANEDHDQGGFDDQAGDYVYTTTFDLTGYDPSTAVITGQISGDNSIESVTLNNHLVAGVNPNPTQYQSFQRLAISSGFIAGVNTLVFTVTNLPPQGRNPTGFRADLSGTADAVPVAAPAGPYNVGHGQPLNVCGSLRLLKNDTDADPTASLTASLDQPPANGTVVVRPDGSFTYTPNPGYAGPDSFTYFASDGVRSSEATASIVVTDTAPVAQAATYGVLAGQTRTVPAYSGLLTHASDADGDPLTVSQAGQPPVHGSVMVNPDGSFSYTPTDPGFTGTDAFQYKVNDGALDSALGTVTVNIHAVNQAPVAPDVPYANVPHDRPFVVGGVGLLAVASDPDSDPLTASLFGGQPLNGHVDVNPGGSFTYTPNAGYIGPDSFQYQVSDGLLTATGTVHLTVVDPNAPVAGVHSYSTGRNNVLTVGSATGLLSDPTTDADGDTLTVVLPTGTVTTTANGTVTVARDGSFVYTPPTGYIGADSFTWRVSDGVLTSDATASIAVVNSAPVANGGAFAVQTGNTLQVPAPGMLANDFDPEHDPITVTGTSNPANGSLTHTTDGAFTYVPHTGYVGPDSFTYQVSDGNLTSTGTINITVKAANNPPMAAAPPTYTLAHDTPLVVGPDSGVLTYASDPDRDPLFAQLSPGGGPSHGSLTLNLDGSFTYTPAAHYFGSDSFTYQVSDGTVSTSPVTAQLQVTNGAPTAGADAYSVLSSGTTSVTAAAGVLANDTDPEGDPLTATRQTPAVHGTAVLQSDGSFTYTPDNSFTGTDSFTYQAFDGVNYSAVTTVSLTTAPVASNLSYHVPHDTTLTVNATTGLLSGVSWAGSGPITLTGVTQPSHGTLRMMADGSFVYTPAPGYYGPDSFTWTATGGGLTSLPATVSLTVDETAPIGNPDFYAVNENGTLTVTAVNGVLANDEDAEGDHLSASLVNRPGHGTIDLSVGGGLSYTPDPGYFGTETFTYQASDGVLSSLPTTVSIRVNQVISGILPPSAVATGSFEGNPSRVDFVVASQTANTITLFQGNGDGTFVQKPAVPVGSGPVALATGDFNGDGKLDLAVVNRGSNTVSILLGNGDGTFTTGSTLTVGHNPAGIVVGDFNRDGKLDLAVTNQGDNTVTVFLGNGDGTFQAETPVAVGTGPSAIQTGDWNGDRKADLMVANTGSNNVTILLGNGDGTFQAQTPIPVGTAPVSIAVADFDGNGTQDVAVANSGSNTVSVLLGNGDGTFAARTDYTVGTGPVNLVAGDFTGSGSVDLAVAVRDSSTGVFLLGSGLGTFSLVGADGPLNVPAPTAVAAADFNGDGVLDEVVAYQGAGGGSQPGLVLALAPAPKIAPPALQVATPRAGSAGAWGTDKGDVYVDNRRFSAYYLPKQTSSITALAFNRGGTRLAVATEDDKIIKVWDVSGTRPAMPVYQATVPASPIAAVAFSDDGRWLAAKTYNTQDLSIFDGGTGKLVRAIRTTGNQSYSLSFVPNKNLLAVGENDALNPENNALRIYDVTTGKVVGSAPTGQPKIVSVACSRDGTTVAVGGSDGTAVLYDITGGAPRQLARIRVQLLGDAKEIRVAFNATGKKLIAGRGDGRINTYSLDFGGGVFRFYYQKPPESDRDYVYCSGGIVSLAVQQGDLHFLVGGLENNRSRVGKWWEGPKILLKDAPSE
jgi:hypothetical protein